MTKKAKCEIVFFDRRSEILSRDDEWQQLVKVRIVHWESPRLAMHTIMECVAIVDGDPVVDTVTVLRNTTSANLQRIGIAKFDDLMRSHPYFSAHNRPPENLEDMS